MRYLVELYSSAVACDPAERSARLRRITRSLDEAGNVVHLRSILVPEDEMCFALYEAASAEDLVAAARAAGVEVERIVEAFDIGSETV